jgi:hypothetical protein
VVLTILWVIDLGAGSIAAYFNDPKFWVKMDSYTFAEWMRQVAPKTYPMSLWVYILVALSYLMVISLLLCTINWLWKRRRKLKGMAEFLIHLGFLLIFTGFVLGSMYGSRVQLQISEGGRAQVPGMGITLELEDLEVVTGPSGRPVDTYSTMSLYRGEEQVADGLARTNSPIIWRSTVIYPPDDYRVWIDGGVVEVGGAEMAQVLSGRRTPLKDGSYLSIGGVLQHGQRRGQVTGPGFLIRLHAGGGSILGSAFLSTAPGMRGVSELGGVPVRLMEFVESATGLYRVHYDPGVWLVLLGTLILALGSIWALVAYFRTPPTAV